MLLRNEQGRKVQICSTSDVWCEISGSFQAILRDQATFDASGDDLTSPVYIK